MSISALRSTRWAFSVMAVTVFSALVLVGCGKDDDDEKDGDKPGLDSKLVCAEGDAWLGGTPTQAGADVAVILKGDGSLVLAQSSDGDNWYQIGTGTWSTSGNNVTVTTKIPGRPQETETETGAYTISADGKTATMTVAGQKQNLTKTPGIIVKQFGDE